MKVLVKTALSEYSGYGQDGIGLIRALIDRGIDTYLLPQHVDPPLPPEVARILEKRLVAPFDLLIQHQDPGLLGLSPEEVASSEVTVAATMWEYTTLSNLNSKDTVVDRMRPFDLFLPYDEVTAECYRPYLEFGDMTENVSENLNKASGRMPQMRILQGGYDPSLWNYIERDWNSERFGFCMVGALHSRKDPWVAIEAFSQLRNERPEFAPAELHLKTTANTLHPGLEKQFPNVRVHMGSWPIDVLHAFYERQHVILAPSRGEGKNLPPLEFMTTGGTAIATNWGGHTQWLDDSIAYKLDYELRPINQKYPECKNARASVKHLKELMWHAFTHRDEVKAKGEKASKVIPATKSWNAYVDNLLNMVCELPGEKGEIMRRALKEVDAP